jgi:tRNA (guanine-N7-)-methyltransferase
MSRKKLRKFQEFESLPNTSSFPEHAAGTWHAPFGNNRPLTTELACGHGVFLVEMARRYPSRNFIGIDIKSARLWSGAKQALDAGLNNVRFVRAEIEQLTNYFAPGEIAELWITFPDPFPKTRQTKKRLTSPRFLDMYEKLLQPGGVLHFKTDDRNLFEYSVETIMHRDIWQLHTLFDNIHTDPERARALDLDIISRYEKMHLQNGKRICYARFISSPVASQASTQRPQK